MNTINLTRYLELLPMNVGNDDQIVVVNFYLKGATIIRLCLLLGVGRNKVVNSWGFYE